MKRKSFQRENRGAFHLKGFRMIFFIKKIKFGAIIQLVQQNTLIQFSITTARLYTGLNTAIQLRSFLCRFFMLLDLQMLNTAIM